VTKRCYLFLLDWKPQAWSTREEYFYRLSRAITARGAVPVLTVSAAPDPEVIARFEEAGARVIACPYDYDTYWRHLRTMALEYSVSLVHVRFFDYFSLVPWFCRSNELRTIVYTDANSGEWSADGWKAALLRLRTKLVCAPIRRVIAVSYFIRRRLMAAGMAESRIAVVYNGVDTESFSAGTQAREPGGAIRIAYASALLDWKRPEIALRVCRELNSRGCSAVLLMAGAGPLRSSLERLSRELGIAGNVEWLDHSPELHRVMQSADIFLHTAIGEAFGNVVAEAMASGVPVVATRSGATSELVSEGETGFLVEPGRSEITQLAAAIERISNDLELRDRMSRTAVETARRRFSVDLAVSETLRVYDELLERWPR
jgi:glycosyltransferase involved in cell wall biosynthesis